MGRPATPTDSSWQRTQDLPPPQARATEPLQGPARPLRAAAEQARQASRLAAASPLSSLPA
eukprot:6026893-Heterocapsa_arctica.AAC.1